MKLPESKLVKRQVKTYGPKLIVGYGRNAQITAKVRHDDECGNGHNSFAITGEVRIPGRNDCEMCGCLHDLIATHFPELKPLIKWHLCGTDGPMHYVANTVYLAGDRDHYGHRKGEPSAFDRVIKWNGFPIDWRGPEKFVQWCGEKGAAVADCEVLQVDHPRDRDIYQPKYTLSGYDCQWHNCPFDAELDALQFLDAVKLGFTVYRVATAWSNGKDRELNSARESAIWPDATDEELCQEPDQLKASLEARLPGIMAEFKTAVESLGFTY